MFSFVILHYGNIEDTINCLTSIKSLLKSDNYNIVIVDNNTLKKEEEKLLKKYTNDILKLDKNYGFAKANNKGILYAKKKYNSKYYIVINNDTLMVKDNFLDVIESDYKKYKFDILGPKISSPTGYSVNPFPVFKTKEEIIREIEKSKKLIKIYNSALLTFLLNIYIGIKHIIKKPIKIENGSKLQEDVALHGCALIFSDKYVKKYDYPFYNDTFLFHEEEFLYQRVIKDSLVSIYDPELKIFHREGSSISKKNKKVRYSKLFREKERIKSLELLLKQM